jgi:hypothetical protein
VSLKEQSTTSKERKRKAMPKQYTEEEQIELIMKALEPRVGKRAQVKRNLVYMKTALGATLVPVEEEGEVNEG